MIKTFKNLCLMVLAFGVSLSAAADDMAQPSCEVLKHRSVLPGMMTTFKVQIPHGTALGERMVNALEQITAREESIANIEWCLKGDKVAEKVSCLGRLNITVHEANEIDRNRFLAKEAGHALFWKSFALEELYEVLDGAHLFNRKEFTLAGCNLADAEQLQVTLEALKGQVVYSNRRYFNASLSSYGTL